MFRHKLSQTGLPYLAIALMLIGTILYFEQHLSFLSNNTQAISITPNHDDNFEKADINDNKVSAPKLSVKTQLLIKELSNKAEKIQSLLELNEDVAKLSKQEQLTLYIALANSFYSKQNYDATSIILKQISTTIRLQKNLQFMYAFSLAKIDNEKEAIKQYSQLLKNKPNSQSANLNLALLLKKLSRCTEAIPRFEHTVSISSGRKKAKAFSGLASCHLEQNNIQQALDLFKKSIEYRPNSATTWALVAKSYSLLGQRKLALSAFDKGIALDRKNYKIFLKKARFQLKYYDFSGASKTLKSAKSLSNNLDIIELMAWSYIELGKRSSARNELSYLIKYSPSKKQKNKAQLLLLYTNKHYKELLSKLKKNKKLSDEFLYLKAITYRKTGYFDRAFDIFRTFSKNNDFYWRSQIQQARMTRSRQQYDTAIGQFDELLNYNLEAGFLWFEVALVHEKSQQYVESLQSITQALNIDPHNNTYLLTNARLLHVSKDNKAAIKILDNILQRHPNYVRALRLLSDIYQESGENKKLLNIYKRSLKLEPNDEILIYKQAELLNQLNNHEAAQKSLITALEIKPDFIDARYLLAISYYQSQAYQLGLQEIENILQLAPGNVRALSLKESILLKINTGISP